MVPGPTDPLLQSFDIGVAQYLIAFTPSKDEEPLADVRSTDFTRWEHSARNRVTHFS